MDELLEVAKSQGPVVLLLVLIIVGGARKTWVFGWVHNERIAADDKRYAEKSEECKFWQTAALKGMSAVEKAVSIVERQVPPVSPP